MDDKTKIRKLTETLRDYDKRFLQDDSDKNDLAIALQVLLRAFPCYHCDALSPTCPRCKGKAELMRIMPEEFHV